MLKLVLLLNIFFLYGCSVNTQNTSKDKISSSKSEYTQALRDCGIDYLEKDNKIMPLILRDLSPNKISEEEMRTIRSYSGCLFRLMKPQLEARYSASVKNY